MSERHERHTVTLNDTAFSRLRNKGHFGESYSKVILRILDQAEKSEKGETK